MFHKLLLFLTKPLVNRRIATYCYPYSEAMYANIKEYYDSHTKTKVF